METPTLEKQQQRRVGDSFATCSQNCDKSSIQNYFYFEEGAVMVQIMHSKQLELGKEVSSFDILHI